MKTSLSVITSAMVLALPAMAQERVAGGPVDTQMTWSALSDQIRTASAKIKGINARFDQHLVLCAKQGKLYAPGTPGRMLPAAWRQVALGLGWRCKVYLPTRPLGSPTRTAIIKMAARLAATPKKHRSDWHQMHNQGGLI